MQILTRLREFANKRQLEYQDEVLTTGDTQASVFSLERVPEYRYSLARIRDATEPVILWILLNPGTGDMEHRPRRTLLRCIDWSKRWAYGGLVLGNVFAVRAKSGDKLKSISEPIGTHNDSAIQTLHRLATRTVVAWGNHGRIRNRADEVSAFLPDSFCPGKTAKGFPRFPGRVAKETTLVAF